jgi:hypothetical protein
MTKQHIAASGKQEGNWVPCSAQQCTLTKNQYHTTSAELIQVQQYFEDKTGNKIASQRVPLQAVLEYKILSEGSKKIIADKVEARKEEARTKKESRKLQAGTVLRNKRAEAYAQYEKDNNAAKYFKNYLADYPNLARLPLSDLRKVFKYAETRYGTAEISGALSNGGNKIGLTSQEKVYKELNDNPRLLPAVLNPVTAERRASAHPARNTALTRVVEEQERRKEAAQRQRIAAGQATDGVKVRRIRAGLSTRTAIKDSLEELKARGCDVSYNEDKGLMSTTFHNVEIVGPSYQIEAWKKWMRDGMF